MRLLQSVHGFVCEVAWPAPYPQKLYYLRRDSVRGEKRFARRRGLFVFCSRGLWGAPRAKRFLDCMFSGDNSTTLTLQRYLYAPLRRIFVDHVQRRAYVECVPLGGLCAIDGAFVSRGVVGDGVAGHSGVRGGGGKTAGDGDPGAGSAAGQCEAGGGDFDLRRRHGGDGCGRRSALENG